MILLGFSASLFIRMMKLSVVEAPLYDIEGLASRFIG